MIIIFTPSLAIVVLFSLLILTLESSVLKLEARAVVWVEAHAESVVSLRFEAGCLACVVCANFISQLCYRVTSDSLPL